MAPRSRAPDRRRARRLALAAVVLGAGALLALAIAIEALRIPPRELARYLNRRAAGHSGWLASMVGHASGLLRELDRGAPLAGLPTFGAGARRPHDATAAPEAGDSRRVAVASVAELRAALANALPGDTIALAPGVYRLSDSPYIPIDRAGRDDAPILVRADVPGTAVIELATPEGFRVAAPNWTFEGLDVRGACRQASECDHAFHVTGFARRFVARDNLVTDFNAHFKINGEDGRFPDEGRIEGNTLRNQAVRQTSAPVTPIDMVGVDGWVVRRNLIADFAKGQGDRVSFGAYAKGAGTGNRFEENVVVCEAAVRGDNDQRVGISLGGGGTERGFCRDHACVAEQFEGVIAKNLIAGCSDDGIYLNRAARSRVIGNALFDTAGLAARFPETSADVRGNVVDGIIRARDDAWMRDADNVETRPLLLYLGVHPLRSRMAERPGTDTNPQ
jgi:hypothetical protein